MKKLRKYLPFLLLAGVGVYLWQKGKIKTIGVITQLPQPTEEQKKLVNRIIDSAPGPMTGDFY